MPLIWIDDTGIHAARQDEIKAYLDSVFKGIYGSDIDLSTETTDGQLIGTQSEMLSDAFQVAVQIYNARSPSGATGAALARLVKLNGVTKKDPAPSSGVVTISGTAGQPVAAGLRIGNAQPGVTATFVTTADATIGGGGTVANVPIVSTTNGPVPGAAGDLSVILTPVPGVTSVTNPADVALGTTGETDAQLRTRRTASVAIPSQGIVDGLEAALLQVPGVTQAVVRENPKDTTQTLAADGGTLAPHAIQVIVLGGADADIAEAIWKKRSLGCTMVGATTVNVTDVQGFTHAVNFDRAATTDIYVKVNTPAALPSDQKAAIAAAIVARGQGSLSINGVAFPASQIGQSVHVSQISDAITYLRVTSMPTLQVDEIDIGTAPSPSSDAAVAIAFDHIAAWDASRIAFNP